MPTVELAAQHTHIGVYILGFCVVVAAVDATVAAQVSMRTAVGAQESCG